MKFLILVALLMTCFGVAAADQVALESREVLHLDQYELQKLRSNGIEIAYLDLGQAGDPAILMVMGLGASHKLWGDRIPLALVDAGYRAVLFDNRDVADSTKFDEHGEPTLWWELLKNTFGIEVNAAYDLTDMANDTIGVMDALNLKKAHIVGASMVG